MIILVLIIAGIGILAPLALIGEALSFAVERDTLAAYICSLIIIIVTIIVMVDMFS